MRDAFGGIFTLQFIVVFMIIVNCFLAFSVNYTKAFRAKNEIRSIIEKNEGLTCNAMCQIEDVLISNNYRLGDATCPTGYKVAEMHDTNYFCYKIEKVDIAGSSDDSKTYKGAYYSIITYVNINIPIFNRIFERTPIHNAFKVKGETALIYSSGVNHSGFDEINCNCE